jgi:hypothetical protein
MKMLLIALIALALLAGLVYLPVVFAMASMSPWQLFQHLCAYVSPGSPQCIQQPQQAITTPPPLSVQQQPTTPFCTTNPNDPACPQQLQQQQQQQAGPPPDGP